MLTVTEEAQEHLSGLLAEVWEGGEPDACLRLELTDLDDPTLSLSEEEPSDHSIAVDGEVVLVWDDQVQSDDVERALVLYDELGAAGQSLFLVWPKADGKLTTRSVALSEDVQEALDGLM